MKENSFALKRQEADYLTETILDVDDADNIALLDNMTAQAKSLLHSLEVWNRQQEAYASMWM